MRPPKLEARHRASVAVSQMFVDCVKALSGTYATDDPNRTSLTKMLIAMVIRLRDNREEPTTLSEIERELGISRRTVTRYVKQLLESGVIERKGEGVTGSDQYLLERIDAPYWRTMVAAIREAARQLEGEP